MFTHEAVERRGDSVAGTTYARWRRGRSCAAHAWVAPKKRAAQPRVQRATALRPTHQRKPPRGLGPSPIGSLSDNEWCPCAINPQTERLQVPFYLATQFPRAAHRAVGTEHHYSLARTRSVAPPKAGNAATHQDCGASAPRSSKSSSSAKDMRKRSRSCLGCRMNRLTRNASSRWRPVDSPPPG
jgi:hypothetical protein